jgi:hypothetical protein
MCVRPLNVRYRRRPGSQYCQFLTAAHERVRRFLPPRTTRRLAVLGASTTLGHSHMFRSSACCDEGEYQRAAMKSNSSTTTERTSYNRGQQGGFPWTS